MPSSSTSTPTSQYHEYRKPGYQRYRDYGPEDYLIPVEKIRDHDGAPLYDDEWSSLRIEIIKNNDVALLRRYIDKFSGACHPGYISTNDPFYIAASYGSTDALRMMLEHWAADPSRTVPAPDERGFELMNAACLCGQVDTVRFLVDESQPWAVRFGKIYKYAENWDGPYVISSLIAAARSYNTRPRGGKAWHNSEDLMCLLLDMGASARDTVSRPDLDDPPPAVPRIRDTVLSLAIAGASADTVRRLVDGGAEISAKVYAPLCHGIFADARDVTVLHIGSFYFNVDGIQGLFDKVPSNVADMVSCRDDHGRTPLHWAAGSDYPETFDFEDCKGNGDDSENIDSQAIGTIKLLLAGNADINARDPKGDTPLRYAVRNYCVWGSHSIERPWNYQIIKLLCESGADARERDSKGRTLLHCMFLHHNEPQPFDEALIALLVGHGVSVDDVDARGRTAVHLGADNLGDAETVRILLGQAGARADGVLRAVDAQGNTPLHVAAASEHAYNAWATGDRIRAQEEMMGALLPRGRAGLGAGEGDTDVVLLMDQPNAAGKTPRQLRQETRKKWRQDDEEPPIKVAVYLTHGDWLLIKENGGGPALVDIPLTM